MMREFDCKTCGKHSNHIGIRGKLPKICEDCRKKKRHEYYTQRKVKMYGQRGSDVQKQQGSDDQGTNDSAQPE